MTGRLLRIWQRTNLWSITIEGEMTWWASDDVHVRKRKIDIELAVPRALWRPYCWVRGRHDEHYNFCVYCNKRLSRRDEHR